MDVLIICIIVLIATILITIISIKLKNKFAKAKFVDLFSYQDKLISVGQVFHSAEDGGFYHTRISLIDKKTGKNFHRISISGEPDVIGIEKQQIWLADKRILAVDFIKNKVVFTTEKIYKKYPEFDNTEFTNPYLNQKVSKMFFKTDTGYRYYIDCKTLVINKINDKTIINEETEESEFEIDDNTLKSKHFSFEKPKKADRYTIKYKKVEIENVKTFIKPQILIEGVSKFAIPEENFIVFIHFQKVHSTSEFILTKINSIGKIEWSLQQKDLKIKKKEDQTTEIKRAIKFDNDLILPISSGTEKLVSINILNGRINWRKSVF